MGIFNRVLAKVTGPVTRQVDDVISVVGQALALYLIKGCSAEWGEDMGTSLAVSATNLLIMREATTRAAKEFARENTDTVDQIINVIAIDNTIRRSLSAFLNVRANLAGNTASVEPMHIEALVRLSNAGFFQEEDCVTFSTLEEFSAQAKIFTDWLSIQDFSSLLDECAVQDPRPPSTSNLDSINAELESLSPTEAVEFYDASEVAAATDDPRLLLLIEIAALKSKADEAAFSGPYSWVRELDNERFEKQRELDLMDIRAELKKIDQQIRGCSQ